MSKPHLCLLFGGSLGLGSLLPVAPDHDHAEERANYCAAEKNEDDGYANCPDTRGEDVLEWVLGVDEGLYGCVSAGQYHILAGEYGP
jgi:hypothetical protein